MIDLSTGYIGDHASSPAFDDVVLVAQPFRLVARVDRRSATASPAASQQQ